MKSAILVSLILSTITFGFPSLKEIQKKMETESQKYNLKNNKVLTTEECTNFTGKWDLTCETSTGQKTEIFEIKQQSCSFIIFDGQYTFINTLKNESNGSQDMNSSYAQILNWNKDRQELGMKVTGLFVSRGDIGFNGQTYGTGSLKLVNNELKREFSVKSLIEINNEIKEIVHFENCTGKKIN